MKIQTPLFGWKSVWQGYGLKGLLLDSILPVFVASLLSIIMWLNESDTYLQLRHLIDVGISVVPAMLALTLAAYTLLLSFVVGDKFSVIRTMDTGRKLIHDLNSSFAASLFVSTITVIVTILTSSIANMDIPIEHPQKVNVPTYFFICYLLVYSVSILFGVIVDIFNSGQTILLDD